ncbi:helix-turn-helix transcriptional regulator [Paenibacillus sacheonensis]|uniref:Helix-turn-helix domain-containing protein n=1 Tax=Paenibacillus sacheonensis TaxID=742054 RepID=A0A7X5BYJ2_9BACL|nr:AraC family transcriptional regulator [Paenibacillus sacheonensis]MBM7565570.1 AraC-like DNA-binding protein/mannose-6-phosphate isomerase-like protein (cupin superfamily) [Paenibacillus sacheonensis]NBC69511.1 helix-turn-helix domain-containing protein [Paenibacillus sacheonensis]
MTFRLLMRERPLRVEHITTDRQQNRKGSVNNRHRHPVFHVMYITDGEGRFLVNDRETRALPGRLYIINPNEWHQFHGDEENPLHNLECTFLVRDDESEPQTENFFDWFEEKRGIIVPQAYRDEPIAVPAQLQPFLLEGFNRLLDPGNRFVTDEHRSLMVTDLLLRAEELLWQLLTSDADRGGRLGGAQEIAVLRRYMAAHLGETIHLEQLAELVHWTPNYLCRVFKAHTGMTPMAQLQSLRMAEAEKLLLYTDYPVFTIAEMLGYEHPSYFARLFRRHRRRAPSDYRKG